MDGFSTVEPITQSAGASYQSINHHMSAIDVGCHDLTSAVHLKLTRLDYYWTTSWAAAGQLAR